MGRCTLPTSKKPQVNGPLEQILAITTATQSQTDLSGWKGHSITTQTVSTPAQGQYFRRYQLNLLNRGDHYHGTASQLKEYVQSKPKTNSATHTSTLIKAGSQFPIHLSNQMLTSHKHTHQRFRFTLTH